MSHYSVLVVVDADEARARARAAELLAPYDEQDESLFEFEDRTDEVMREFESRPGRWESPAECAERCFGYVPDESGRFGRFSNPSAKWDWYEFGGSWEGLLPLKDGYVADVAPVSEIALAPDEGAYKAAVARWEANMAAEEPDWGHGVTNEAMVARYRDADSYAKCRSRLHTFAVVTPDGAWHEPPRHGYGTPPETVTEGRLEWDLAYQSRFLDGIDPDACLVVVDAHI